jgi:hypothetical protein
VGSFQLSDIFREVDEEVRREQLAKLWDRYGTLIIAAAILLVVGVAAWRGYEWWENRKAAASGAAFEAAIALSEQSKPEEAQAAFAKIAAEGTPGYRALARMREAAELTTKDPQGAVALYDKVAAERDIGQVLQDLATIRASAILVDTAPYDEIRRRLEPLADDKRTFRHTARELLALSAWKANDMTSAKRWFDAVMSDGETPVATRSRVEVLMALAAAEGRS